MPASRANGLDIVNEVAGQDPLADAKEKRP